MNMENEKKEDGKLDNENTKQEETARQDTVEPGTVKDIGFYFLNLLSVKGWQYMGLMVHPENGQIVVDFKQAQQAIDLFSLVFDFLKHDLNHEETRELQSQLSNLQLNYVEKKGQTDGSQPDEG